MFWHNNHHIFREETSPELVVSKLKALLHNYKEDVHHFSFQPLRTVGWNGTAVSYKLTPLLSDDQGCIAVRISPETMSKILSTMQADEDLIVVSTKTKLFQIDSYHRHRVQLRADSPLVSSPLPSPKISDLKLQYFPPTEKRIEPEWQENEGRSSQLSLS
ncbi:hypothetical protein NliqN6_0423 [Naganishia liquefaciens]|uniref:Uncharacterized protein n=1 Tax=Naganishia liquefaciens TaxID=104408 RepID=A0A8H3TNJ4_9TREE|nr:hypothetical protein NliqN6_0423 [Naganishia liquefaciens]